MNRDKAHLPLEVNFSVSAFIRTLIERRSDSG